MGFLLAVNDFWNRVEPDYICTRVHRRTGGLEIIVKVPTVQAMVNRRIGGLEKPMRGNQSPFTVNRRISPRGGWNVAFGYPRF